MKQPIDPAGFGRRVREKREELNLSQEALGKLSGQSQSNIDWIESGKLKDPTKKVVRLAEPLRTSINWLLYETGERNTAPAPLTDEEIANYYRQASLESRDSITAFILNLVSQKQSKKRRSS